MFGVILCFLLLNNMVATSNISDKMTLGLVGTIPMIFIAFGFLLWTSRARDLGVPRTSRHRDRATVGRL